MVLIILYHILVDKMKK